ncbi:thioredoxin family protein [Paracoccus sp. (in: a-proteobacteria)]|uniref:thioredoxin family protein n=1 Tax=Paracoccus sp. TaxID=267 RepID=UPI0026E10579|nr:thioredoxin family protein [Paracoccus sp. (in: a-proteobacteria)]MDO5647123.1 thioredoxin family protein [Paracoccus sp. (in: a-proteobacteria)]
MAVSPPVCDFGWPAPDFRLPATDGTLWTMRDVAGPRGTLIMFICNHCPYVLSVLDRILRDAREMQGFGIGVAAICSNDATAYPDDALPQMAKLARDRDFPFPYLHDETQDVARDWGAVCTPDFFGLDAGDGLQYRGRLDASGRNPGPTDAARELRDAMRLIADTGHGPVDQIPSMGCSIKWKS